MKKALIYIVGLVAIFGCNKVEFISGSSDKDAIVFDNVQTKAVISSADQIMNFGVIAQMNTGNEDLSEPGSNNYVLLLNNEEVSRTAVGEPWTYENTRYWVTDRVYHFFAAWPYPDADGPVTNLSSVAPDGNGEYGYSVTFDTPETADQELLTSQASVKTKTGLDFPPGAVGFDMQHELTNVHFKLWRDAKDDNGNLKDKIRVKQVIISNVTKKATLTANRISSSWNHSSSKMTITKDYGETGIDVAAATLVDGQLNIVNDGKQPGVPFGDDGLLLIPHTMTSSNAVIVKVIYDLQRPIDQEDDLWEEKTLQAFLPEGTWPAGKRVTYNMVISGERTITQFQINTIVEDWDRQTDDIDFSEQVSSKDPIEWLPGTYESVDDVKCEVVVYTDESMVATCRFKIDTPVGATWTASLIPLTESAMDAFSIVENTKYGEVGTGEWQYVKIMVNNQAPMAPRHACKLRITVQTVDGRSIVVKDLMPDSAANGVEEYTIIQNLING